jgi:hypothetical protein
MNGFAARSHDEPINGLLDSGFLSSCGSQR